MSQIKEMSAEEARIFAKRMKAKLLLALDGENLLDSIPFLLAFAVMAAKATDATVAELLAEIDSDYKDERFRCTPKEIAGGKWDIIQ
jgi:hypothetical protein